MGEYLAMRIMQGHLDYGVIVGLYPQFKEEIDSILTENGREELIVEEPKEEEPVDEDIDLGDDGQIGIDVPAYRGE